MLINLGTHEEVCRSANRNHNEPGNRNNNVGRDEAGVYRQLCQAAEEWVGIIEGDGHPIRSLAAGNNHGSGGMRQGTARPSRRR